MSHSQPKETSPSARSVFGLNGLVFCLSDVRHGIGPLLTIYLKNVLHWDPERIGLALAMPDVTALLFQVPAGVVADETKRKKNIRCLGMSLYSHRVCVYLSFAFILVDFDCSAFYGTCDFFYRAAFGSDNARPFWQSAFSKAGQFK